MQLPFNLLDLHTNCDDEQLAAQLKTIQKPFAQCLHFDSIRVPNKFYVDEVSDETKKDIYCTLAQMWPQCWHYLDGKRSSFAVNTINITVPGLSCIDTRHDALGMDYPFNPFFERDLFAEGFAAHRGLEGMTSIYRTKCIESSVADYDRVPTDFNDIMNDDSS